MRDKPRKTIGFWWKPQLGAFVSEAADIKELAGTDGPVRFYLRKNQYFSKDSNRPNYQMSVSSADKASPAAEETKQETETYTLSELRGAVIRAASSMSTEDAVMLWDSIRENLSNGNGKEG